MQTMIDFRCLLWTTLIYSLAFMFTPVIPSSPVCRNRIRNILSTTTWCGQLAREGLRNNTRTITRQAIRCCGRWHRRGGKKPKTAVPSALGSVRLCHSRPGTARNGSGVVQSSKKGIPGLNPDQVGPQPNEQWLGSYCSTCTRKDLA
jgi:hypothetical protein